MTTTEAPSTQRRTSVDLDVRGMTCASCAARIEKKLNKVDGVSASVNYATNKAAVLAPTGITAEDLIRVVEQAGYGASVPLPDAPPPPDPAIAIRRRLVVAAVLAVPVILMAMVPALQFPGWQWLSLALATPIVTWAAWPFHRSALVNLRHGATTMDTLISLGTTAAFGWSVYALLFGTAGRIGMTHPFEFSLMRHGGDSYIYFEAAAGIITFILLGRWFEARARTEAGSAIQALLELGAKDVALLVDGVETRVPIAHLKAGDEFVVRPGEKIATDGVIVDGSSAVDNALVTGESLPVDVGRDDAVVGATLNTTGRLVVRATRVGADTQLAQMAHLVEQAQTGKAQVQRLADRIAGVFVPIVIVIAAGTFVTWLLLGEGVSFSLTAAVAVLIIACPCALGLATPTALMVGTGRGAQLGIIIKGPQVLESTRAVDTIVLDKTGTLTTGAMGVAAVFPVEGADEAELRRLTAAVESHSEHPIARAVARDLAVAPSTVVVDDFTNLPGRGVTAIADGRRVQIGSATLLADEGVTVGADVQTFLDRERLMGRSTLLIALDGSVAGAVSVADSLKPTAKDAIAAYEHLGLRTVLLSGDHAAAANHLAATLGIDEVIAEVSPAAKVDAIRRLQDEGRVVAMVGDGVNDAAALAQADLGVAMGSGTDAAISASDLTLMTSDPLVAATAIRLSRATLRTIKVNLFWAFAYNVAAIPLAAVGYLNPMFAGAAMAFSSVFVVSNSLRLRGFR